MRELSDTQIRASLRTLLTESGVDPNRTSLLCASGTVRVLGKLLGISEAPVQPGQVNELEQSIRRSNGVKRVHFHLENWTRLPDGRWEEIKDEEKKRKLTGLPGDELRSED